MGKVLRPGGRCLAFGVTVHEAAKTVPRSHPGPQGSGVPHAGLGAGPCLHSSPAVLGDHSPRHQRCGWKEASRLRASAGEAAGRLKTPAAGCDTEWLLSSAADTRRRRSGRGRPGSL